MSDENVRVAVRVRPFNQREKEAGSSLVISMTGNQTIISKPKSSEEPKKFGFDYSYWSHDGFKTDANGFFVPEGSKYADQKKVFTDLGLGVLNNSWNGFNASLFAYGQTGSGKLYSVVGYGANKGIVPLVCEEIFKRIDKAKGSGTQYEVTFSMLEIYSEAVRDLLNTQTDKRQSLLIREDPKVGFYPQGLRKQLVTSYNDIIKLMDEGNASRTIAATNMNATSSRAHTIVTVSLVQKYKNPSGKEMAKSSLINLVDLAGSERANATGATGDRLKEGAAINLSLTSLGNVIAALADNSSGKNVRVPYRDSVLTKLLMNALGGNSKTIMIAAISPADINYDESLSTLRYADRAKQIKCKAVVNEDPTEKLIKSLQDENTKLKELLKSGKIDPALLSTLGGDSETGKGQEDLLKKALEENEKQMNTMKKSFEEKLAEAKTQSGDTVKSQVMEKAKKFPHLSNINMDPSLSHSVKIVFEGDGQKKIGVAGKADIPLYGLGIMDPHGLVTIKAGKVTIERIGQSKILQNGRLLTHPTELAHMDRLVFGASQYFIYIDPSKKSPKDGDFTFEMAQDEIAKASGITSDTKDMTKEEIQCQNELVDLIPGVEEANMMSILLDKKVKFEVLVVKAESRGEYCGTVKAMVLVKNFATGLEWVWPKNKFLDRKTMMSEYYADFKENGKIDSAKYQKFDPFQESPDTPTQIGTAVLYAKSLAYMLENRGEHKIVDLQGRVAGTINIELLPCDNTGKVLTDKDNVLIRDPQKDLLNKDITFIVKINSIRGLNEKFEDIYCQYTLFEDPKIIKTEVVHGTHKPDFKHSKEFKMKVTSKFIENLIDEYFYIQVWGEQLHPKPDAMNTKISTKEFFEREKESGGLKPASNFIKEKIIDPEKEFLEEELHLALVKEKRLQTMLENVQKLVEKANSTNKSRVPIPVLVKVIETSDAKELQRIIEKYAAEPDNAPPGTVVVQAGGQPGAQPNSVTCSIL